MNGMLLTLFHNEYDGAFLVNRHDIRYMTLLFWSEIL